MNAPTPSSKLLAICPQCGQRNRVVVGTVRCGRSRATFQVHPTTQALAGPGPAYPVRDRLVKALNDDNPLARVNAMIALEDHLDATLIPLMEQLMSHPDGHIRAIAIRYYADLNRGSNPRSPPTDGEGHQGRWRGLYTGSVDELSTGQWLMDKVTGKRGQIAEVFTDGWVQLLMENGESLRVRVHPA
jgi:hypothetical protein